MSLLLSILACAACLCYAEQSEGQAHSSAALHTLMTQLLALGPTGARTSSHADTLRVAVPSMRANRGGKNIRGRKRWGTSKRKQALDKLANKDSEPMDLPEAVARMKELASAGFIETAELHANLNLDPKYNDQQIRTTVSLPHGIGKDVRVAVLAEGTAADDAEAAGADLVGMDGLIEDITNGQLDFDVLLAVPAAMPKLAKLGRVLGPKGLMPSPKAGTVSPTPGDAVKEFKAGKLEFRTDKTGNVHVPFGKMDFEQDKLEENLVALLQVIGKARPSGCKGKLFKTLNIASTMGPVIRMDMTESLKTAAVVA